MRLIFIALFDYENFLTTKISRFTVLYPGWRGLSARSVRRFCAEQGNLLSDDALDRVIQSQVSAVGHAYRRRCMHGLLRAEGVRVCQQGA